MEHNTFTPNQTSSEVILKSSKIIGLFLFLMSFSLIGHAQYDFREGSIILNSNDTISGLIDYSTPKINAESCNFKLNEVGEITKYAPDELKAYYFKESKVYISKYIQIGNSEKQCFLEYLIDGIVDIYYLKDGQFAYYFIEDEKGLHELNIENRTIRKDGTIYEIVEERYKKILTALMQDSEGISKDIEKTELNHVSLIKLTEKYHNSVCDNQSCIIYSKPEIQLNDAKWRVRIGVSIGSVSSRLNLASLVTWRKPYKFSENRVETIILVNSNLTDSVGEPDLISIKDNAVLPGLFLNFSRSRRSSIQLEVHHYKNTFLLDGYEMNLNSLLFPVLYKYEFSPYKKIRPFANLGMVITYNNIAITEGEIYLDYKYPIRENSEILFLPAQSKLSYYPEFEDAERSLNFIAGVGLALYPNKRNTIEIELRYWESEKRFSGYFDDVAKISSAGLFKNWALLGKFSF